MNTTAPITYTTRNNFGTLFNEVFSTGLGAEVGVQNGFNSLQILKNWRGKLLCVDTWEDTHAHINAEINLHGTYAILIKGNSVNVAPALADGALDFVYIDAGHSYPEVKADFEAWYNKVRTGGIISGHDYGINDCIGVKEFIDEYMQLHPDLQMNFTTDDFFEGVEYQSWWFVKP